MKRVFYTCLLALVSLLFFGKTNAQSNIIGNPIKIGNLQVTQFDFRKISWNDGNNACVNLGDGWRLPTIEELKTLYQNRETIGNFKDDSYWSSTKGNVVIAWRLNFDDGMIYDRDNTDNSAYVRAVRSSYNKKVIKQSELDNNESIITKENTFDSLPNQQKPVITKNVPDSLIISNSVESPNLYYSSNQIPNCKECQEALSLYRDAFERRMEFPLEEFLPIVSLIKTCERNNSNCYLNNRASLNFFYANPNPALEKDLGNYFLGTFNDFRYIKIKDANEVIKDFKKIYDAKLSPNCDECIDLFEKYHTAFKSNKFDSTLKVLVQRCRFQIYYRGVCDELKKKMENEKFADKVIMFCNGCGISRMGYSNDFVKKWAIDRIIIPKMSQPAFSFSRESYNFMKNESVIKIDEKWGVMGGGIVFIKPEFDNIQPIKLGKTILYLVAKNSKKGIVNSVGIELLKPYFDEIYESNIMLSQFNLRLETINNEELKKRIYNNAKFLLYRLNGKYGIISNHDNSINISPIIIDEVNLAKQGMAITKRGNKYGFINYDFSTFILPKYDSISDFGCDQSQNRCNLYSTFYKKNGKWGILNTSNGAELTNAKYDEFRRLYNNDSIYIIKNDSKFGLVSSIGTELLAPKFDSIRNYVVDNYASFKLENKWGIINLKGQIIIPPKYDNEFSFDNDVANVMLNGKVYQIDKFNNFISNSKNSNTKNGLSSKQYSTNQNNYIGIGNIDVLTKDLGVLNYYQAKQAIEDLGDGWRLPNENELHLLYDNQSSIGGLTRTRTYVGKEQVSTYLGGGFDKYYYELYTDAILAADGNTYQRNWDSNPKDKLYFYVRPVRNRTAYENKNITSNKKKTTNNNDDVLSTILSLYQKQVLSDARSINKSSGNLDFGGKKSSNTQSQSNSGSDVCQRCKPSNNKGWYISDFNPSNRTYENFRYVLRPGYKMCTNCKGTGDCRVNCFRGKSDCPGVCSDNGTCLVCKGDRFVICRDCNGSGRKN
jgi:hypothetical protein